MAFMNDMWRNSTLPHYVFSIIILHYMCVMFNVCEWKKFSMETGSYPPGIGA